jgi:hypothetical protein
MYEKERDILEYLHVDKRIILKEVLGRLERGSVD